MEASAQRSRRASAWVGLVLVSLVAMELATATASPPRSPGATRALRPNRGLSESVAKLKQHALVFDGGPVAHKRGVDATAKVRVAKQRRSQTVDPAAHAVVQSVYARLRQVAADNHGLVIDGLAPEVLITEKGSAFKTAALMGGHQIAMTDEFVAELMRVAVRAQAAKTPQELMTSLAREADGQHVEATDQAKQNVRGVFASLVAAVVGHEMTHHLRQDPYRRRLLPGDGQAAIGWRRGNEHAADIVGQRLASEAGYLPEGRVLVQLFRSMRQAGNQPVVDKTEYHPHWTLRLQRNMRTLAEATASAQGPAPATPLPTYEQALTFIRAHRM